MPFRDYRDYPAGLKLTLFIQPTIPPPFIQLDRAISRAMIEPMNGSYYFSLDSISEIYKLPNSEAGVPQCFNVFLNDLFKNNKKTILNHINHADYAELILPLNNQELLQGEHEIEGDWKERRYRLIEQCYEFSKQLIITCVNSKRTKIIHLGHLMSQQNVFAHNVGTEENPKHEFLVHPDIVAYAIRKISEKHPGEVTLSFSCEKSLKLMDRSNVFLKKYQAAQKTVTCSLTEYEMPDGKKMICMKAISPRHEKSASATSTQANKVARVSAIAPYKRGPLVHPDVVACAIWRINKKDSDKANANAATSHKRVSVV